MVERLKNRIAIVTGAGQGIGAATARCFAAEGARVVVAEINPETGAAISAELVAKGAQAMFVATDVTESGLGRPHGGEDQGSLWNARYPGEQCRHQRVPRSAVYDRGGMAPLHVGRSRRRLELQPRRAAGDAGG